MQIVSNSTGLLADLTVQTAPDGRDHCVVVIKGTFLTSGDGKLTLAHQQLPLTTVDLHEGEPGCSAVVLESDFALEKPLTDVVVLGRAVAPEGRAVTEMVVRLEIAGRVKEAVVVGDRRWERSLTGIVPSSPVPFTELPLAFGRAFGGVDASRGPDDVAVEDDNPVGVGLHVHRSDDEIIGTPLPNVEDPAVRIVGPRDRPRPIGFGVIGRAWRTRRGYAGTYDARWREGVCPFLPDDFDPRYHQCAPLDQQVPRLRGGEVIRAWGMSALGAVVYVLPTHLPPVHFQFEQAVITREAELDTVILEPHLGRASLVWRASAPLGKRLVALRGVSVGVQPSPTRADGPIGMRRGKPLFPGIGPTIRWLRERRGAGGG